MGDPYFTLKQNLFSYSLKFSSTLGSLVDKKLRVFSRKMIIYWDHFLENGLGNGLGNCKLLPGKWTITFRKMDNYFPENGPSLPGKVNYFPEKWAVSSREIVNYFPEMVNYFREMVNYFPEKWIISSGKCLGIYV